MERGVIKKIMEVAESVRQTKTEEGHLKFSVAWFVQVLNGSILIKLHSKMSCMENQEADLVDFVKTTMELIPIDDKEVLFLIVSATDFFKQVCETYGLQKAIRFKDVTNFVIEVSQIKHSKWLKRTKTARSLRLRLWH